MEKIIMGAVQQAILPDLGNICAIMFISQFVSFEFTPIINCICFPPPTTNQ
jgi:hypothetical protein